MAMKLTAYLPDEHENIVKATPISQMTVYAIRNSSDKKQWSNISKYGVETAHAVDYHLYIDSAYVHKLDVNARKEAVIIDKNAKRTVLTFLDRLSIELSLSWKFYHALKFLLDFSETLQEILPSTNAKTQEIESDITKLREFLEIRSP